MSARDEFRTIVETEIPRHPLSPAATERLVATYKMLGEQKETSQKRPYRRWAVSLSAVTAAFVLLFGVNAVFPAFAEELPVVGTLFHQLNSSLGRYAPTYDDLIQPISKSTSSEKYGLTVTSSYSDGKYLVFDLKLNTEDKELLAMPHLRSGTHLSEGEPIPGYTLTINGEAVESEPAGLTFNSAEDYETALSVLLPEKLRNSETLHAELTIHQLAGDNEAEMRQIVFVPSDELLTEENVSISFDVAVKTEYNKEGKDSPFTARSVTLESWESSPSRFSVRLSYPWDGVIGVYPVATTDSGVDLSVYGCTDPDELDGLYAKDAGEIISAGYFFSGPPEGTKTVTVTVYNHWTDSYMEYVNGGLIGPAVFAEFTIDLETGAVTSTETFREKGYEYMDVNEYAAAMKQGPEFKDHIFVSAYDFTTGIGSGSQENTPDPKDGAFLSNFIFYTDVDEALPLEARFYLDGKMYAAVPLCEDSQENHVADHDSEFWFKEGDNYRAWLGKGRVGVGPFPIPAARIYTFEAYALDVHSDPEDMNFGKDHGAKVELVNTETGEVLYDSSVQVPTLYPREELEQ